MRTKRNYKLQHQDLIQPKNRKDPMYELVDQFFVNGDVKEIASDAGVNESSVSDVKSGRCRSAEIWDRIMVKVMKRAAERAKVMAYLQKAA